MCRFKKVVESAGRMSGGDQAQDKGKSFAPEEGSKVTLRHISELMQSDFAWASIALIAHLAQECECVGTWCEACPCPHHQFVVEEKVPGIKRSCAALPSDAATCPFRSCRAPELACGLGMLHHSRKMSGNQTRFNEYVSRAPSAKRPELYNTWSKATSKIWGHSGSDLDLPMIQSLGISLISLSLAMFSILQSFADRPPADL